MFDINYMHMKISKFYCFGQGIGRLVESSPEDAAEFGEVDLGDREQVLLRGVTEEQHSKHRHELARLQAL